MQIDSDIEDRPANHAHQFALSVGDLVMQSPQNIFTTLAMVVLHKRDVYAGCVRKIPLVKTFKKKAATICKYLGLEYQDA